MKKILAMLLAIAMLAACGVTAFAEEPQNIIKYSIADDPQQMDPTLNS